MSDSLLELASEWRKKWKHTNLGGFVIFFNDAPYGWTHELNSPEAWAPGCVAINESGECWVAIGGDDYDGAQEWLSIDEITWANIASCVVRFSNHYKGFHFVGTTTEGLQIRVTKYTDDDRFRIDTKPISLEDLAPDNVTVAGFQIDVWSEL